MRYAACLWNRSHLDAYADGELAGRRARRVEGHLQGCTGCQAHVDEALALAARVRGGGVEVAEPDWRPFWPGIAARIHAGRAPAVRDPWWLPFWRPIWGHPRVATLATASLLLVAGAGMWTGYDPDGPGGQVIVQDVGTSQPDSSVMVYASRQEPTVIWLFDKDPD